MRTELSRNGEAILLLTAPLSAGKAIGSEKPLSLGDYNALARFLHAAKKEPADLLAPKALKGLRDSVPKLETARVKRLLGRGEVLELALDRWAAHKIWVVTRADPEYPRRLKKRLRAKAPPVIYGCGDGSRLNNGGLAVVGSRSIGEDLTKYTEDIGHLAAEAKVAIISGGARGVDQAAMRGVMAVTGGRAVGVLGNDLERTAMNRHNRQPLMQGQLTMISEFDPAARFRGWRAMQRNKLIYALADAALVVNSDLQGGTWSGATEQLSKYQFVQVYVRSRGAYSSGLDALRTRGAEPWPEPTTPRELMQIIYKSRSSVPCASAF